MSAAIWETKKLDQLGFVGRGKSKHRPRDDARLYNGPYPFFQTGDVKSADFYLSRYSQTYSEFGLSQSKLWPAGTLCVTIAANIGESAILAIPGCFPDSVVGFIAYENVSDVRFVKYSIDVFKLRMKAISGGATQDNMSLDKLLTFDFPVPSLQIQRRIASILSAYDDLIENNRKRSAILEEMARRLYREWFVHFRYPGHESVPLIESHSGRIPLGWEISILENVCARIASGSTPPRDDKSLWNGGTVDWYKTQELWDCDLFGAEEKIVPGSRVRLFNSGTILVAIYGASIGRLGVLHNTASCNQAALGIVADGQRTTVSHLYYTLLSLRDYFIGIAQGAAQQNISKEKVCEAPFVIPNSKILMDFEGIVGPMMKLRYALSRQSYNLLRTRDLLLPRLMSGQLSVEAAEAAVP
jgi:type I restriction enzyme S subunit